MDHAAMLAENKERERQWRLQHLQQHTPPWPVRNNSHQFFAFPYSANELGADRQRVRQIMDVRMRLEGAPHYKHLGEPLAFQDAFIYTHDQRRTLMCRVLERYDNHLQNALVAMHVDNFPWPATPTPGTPGFHSDMNVRARLQQEADVRFDNAVTAWKSAVASSYPSAKSFMYEHLEHLLQMQVLCEALKPETRELVTRCADFEELDRSMLMAATPELPNIPRTFQFKATAPVFGAAASLQ